MTKGQLRWGILGVANIAKGSVIPGIQQSKTGKIVAIASRTEQKAEEAAKSFDIPKAYGSYEALLADEEVDAVYIPLPNHLHKEWTIRAAEAGKHILCEKPLALNAQEAQEMADACQQAGVLLAEAFMYRHHPRYERIQDILRSGEVGDLRGIHSTFTFNGAGNKSNIRFNQQMGGGSIYDIGVYPISVARLLLQAEPEAVTCHAFFSPEHDHVDMMVSGLIEFPGNISLTFDCGMWAAFRNTLEVVGTDGIIEVPSAFVARMDDNDHFYVVTKDGRRKEEVPLINHYAAQADDFAESVFSNQPLKFGTEDAVRNMRVVDACLQSAKERTRIVLKEGVDL